MDRTIGYAAHSATSLLTPFQFQRRELGQNDIHIEIMYCGVIDMSTLISDKTKAVM